MGRLSVIPMARMVMVRTVVSTEKLLGLAVVLCVWALIPLLIFPDSHVALTNVTDVFGLFLAAVFPSVMTMVQNWNANLIIVSGAAIGEMIVPVLMGNYITKFTGIVFALTVIQAVLALVFVAVNSGCSQHETTSEPQTTEMAPI